MSDKEEYSAKETKRKEKLKAEEVEQIAKDEVRKKAYLAREQEIEKSQKAKNAKQAEKRASEDIKDSAREKTRQETYLAHEKQIDEEQKTRRLEERKQSLK